MANFISTEDWADFLHDGLIAAGVVPDEDMIMIVIDLTLEFFEKQNIIDYSIEIE